MSDYSVTCTLAIASCLLWTWLVVSTPKPMITICHVVAAKALLSYTIRPLVSVWSGGTVLFGGNVEWASYNWGLLYQFGFDCSFICAYILVYRPLKKARSVAIGVGWAQATLALSIGLLTLAIMHLLSGGMWLPSSRTQAVTTLMVGGPVLFRIAAVTLSGAVALAVAAYFSDAHRRWWRGASIALLALLGLILLYQRGLALIGFLVAGWIATRRVRLGSAQMMGLAVVLLCGVAALRPVAQTISRGLVSTTDYANEYAVSRSDQPTFQETLVSYTNSYAWVDVWPVVASYINDHGYMGGSGILNTPASILPFSTRWQIGATTTGDRLNYYYYGDRYFSTQYGFNVTLPQNIVLNWGSGFIMLGIIPGFIVGRIDTWLCRLKKINSWTVFFVIAAVISGGFVGDWGILSYSLGYLLVGGAFYAVFRRSSVEKRRSSARRLSVRRVVGRGATQQALSVEK